MAGFVYILSNPSLAGRLKIGKSDRDPMRRRAELSTTGVPEPFCLEYSARVDDHHYAERQIHSALREFRPNRSREFFQVSIPDAIALIRQSCRILEEDVRYKSPEEIRRAELELRQRRQEADERELRVRERQEKISAWVQTQNRDTDKRRQNYVSSRTSTVQLVIGAAALVGAASVIDYSGWAVAGVLIVAWFAYGAWTDAIVAAARREYPQVSAGDYVDPAVVATKLRTQIRCRGCNGILSLPAGKHLNVSCPRCRTSWVQRT